MKKIKTVKQIRLEKWYYELHRLSSALSSWVGCFLIMFGIMLNICFLAFVMCRPTVSARKNFMVYVLQATSTYELLRILLFITVGVMIPSLFLIFSFDIAIYWKLVRLKKGKVVFINGDGIELTLQESCSLKTCEKAMKLIFPKRREFTNITCEFVSKRMVFLLNETDLRIFDFLNMKFLLLLYGLVGWVYW